MTRRTPDFARVLTATSDKADGDETSLRADEIESVLELAFLMDKRAHELGLETTHALLAVP